MSSSLALVLRCVVLANKYWTCNAVAIWLTNSVSPILDTVSLPAYPKPPTGQRLHPIAGVNGPEIGLR